MRSRAWLKAAIALAVLVIIVVVWQRVTRKPDDLGNARYFADASYNFETQRVLNDTLEVGADTTLIAQTVAGLKAGDADGWYQRWSKAGERELALAAHTADPQDKGNALLRAHNYYRAAEFFLAPGDVRRKTAWQANISAFYKGLDTLGVKYERIVVSYGKYHLNALYYPGPAGAESKPLLVMVNGYDGTMEELYFQFVAAALRHGYSVLTYEGPGQGSVLRQQGLVMTPQWEKPNSAVLNTFLAKHPTSDQIVLIGEGIGGYLAPRAAAFDPRIAGVIAHDVFYDGRALAARKTMPIVGWPSSDDESKAVETSALQRGEWVFGARNAGATLGALRDYTLAPVASRIHGDVLILAGADDPLVPLDQVNQFEQSLSNARSVSAIVFDHASGGAEHCQMGAPGVWQAAVFDWLSTKFGEPRDVQQLGGKQSL